MAAERASLAEGSAVRSGSLAAWAVAVRPRTLFVAISPVLVGATMGFERTGAIDWVAALLVLGAALLMQVISNMQNDVGYTVRGGDSSGTRTGLPRATAKGWLSVRHVRAGIVVAALVSVALGLALVAYRGWPVLAIGSASLLAALAYMGGPEADCLHAFRRVDGVRVLRPGGSDRHRLGAHRRRRRGQRAGLGGHRQPGGGRAGGEQPSRHRP